MMKIVTAAHIRRPHDPSSDRRPLRLEISRRRAHTRAGREKFVQSCVDQYINGNSSQFGAYRQTSLAFLYGGGADYRLWRRLWVRAQYRGLIFRAPDFGVSDLFISAKGHMAEPSLGLVVKF